MKEHIAPAAPEPLRVPSLVYEDGALVQPGPPHPADVETACSMPFRREDGLVLLAAVVWIAAEFPLILHLIVG